MSFSSSTAVRFSDIRQSSGRRLICLLAGLTLSYTCIAAASTPEELREQASLLRSEAQQIQAASEAEKPGEQAACYQKFLVNRCLAQVRDAHVERIQGARQRTIRAGELERQAKRLELELAAAKAEAEAPQREAHKQAEISQYQTDYQQRQQQYAIDDARRARDAQEAPQRAEKERLDRLKREDEAMQRRRQERDEARQRASQAREDAARYDDTARKQREKKDSKATQ